MTTSHFRIVTPCILEDRLGLKLAQAARKPHSKATMAVTYFHDNDSNVLGYACVSLDHIGGATFEQCAVAVEPMEPSEAHSTLWL